MLSTRKDSWMMTQEDMQLLLHVAEWTLNHRHDRRHSPDVHRWYGNRYETDASGRSNCARLRFRRCGGSFRRGNSFLIHARIFTPYELISRNTAHGDECEYLRTNIKRIGQTPHQRGNDNPGSGGD